LLRASTFAIKFPNTRLVFSEHRNLGAARHGALSKSHAARACTLNQPLPITTPTVFFPPFNRGVMSRVTYSTRLS
jgi:hypothetical protein